MARPALELVAPRLRPGAVIVADNTDQFREAYRHFFAFIDDPAKLPAEPGSDLEAGLGLLPK